MKRLPSRISRTAIKQAGFTLIELAVVIAIIVAAAAGIIARRNSTDQTAKVQAESGNMTALIGKVNSTFAGRSNYSGLSTALMLAQGGFPTSMVIGTTANNIWQGSVSVDSSATPFSSFNITYGGVPSSACIELVSNVERGFLLVTVGSTVVKVDAFTPADLSLTKTACGSGTLNTIVFNSK